MSKIVDRIRKLVELSKSNNSAEEAASAAAMASDLMFKYQIGEADLQTSDKREQEQLVEESIGQEKKRQRDVWKACLAHAVAKGFGCEMYNSRDEKGNPKFQIFGVKSVVQTVSYVYGYLALEIERLCTAAWKTHGGKEDSFNARAKARTWKNSFRMGAMNAIRVRLEKQRTEQQAQVAEMVAAQKAAPEAPKSTSLALFKTDEERVEEGYKDLSRKLHLRAGRATRVNHSKNAYEHGREAGNGVALGSRGTGLGAPAAQVRS